MSRSNYQTNRTRQLLSLALATVMLTSIFVVTSHSEAGASAIAKANAVKNQPLALKANGKIAFVSNRDGNAEIYLMEPDGSNQTRLTNTQGEELAPVWSPDGTKIMFESNRDGNYEIYAMNSDGSHQMRLTNNPAADDSGAWSPDGTRIAFTSSRDGNSEIYVMSADGSNQVRLTNDPASDQFPSWSPDGTKIAFGRYTESGSGIVVMNADGANQMQIFRGPNDLLSWAPDGSKLALTVGQSIYVVNTDGSNAKRITANPDPAGGADYSPAWSPDSSQIAFSREVNCQFSFFDFEFICDAQIWIVNADGSTQRPLTDGTRRYDTWPVWSPDGSKITFGHFGRDTNGHSGIFVANVNGTGFTNISHTLAADDYSPAWQPVPSNCAYSISPTGQSFFTGHSTGSVSVATTSGCDWQASSSVSWITIDSGKSGNGGAAVNFSVAANPEVNPRTASLTIAGQTFIVNQAGSPPVNSADDAQFFVRQNYLDFLNREPDQNGLAFWTREIVACGNDAQCIEAKRINVSAAFFLSIEFQQTGYLVERIYKAAYGNGSGASTFGGAHQLAVPVVRFNEFLPDTQEIGQGVIVGQAGWPAVLESNTQAFTAEFVQRSRFTAAFPNSMTATQFVDTLNTNAGNPLSSAERNQLVTDLSTNAKTRAQVLRAVADDPDLNSAEFNRAFVLMEYFGYLRRNPNDAPDSNYSGYDFWLTKLNQFNGNYQNAEMVKAFILSGEYRQRFGP